MKGQIAASQLPNEVLLIGWWRLWFLLYRLHWFRKPAPRGLLGQSQKSRLLSHPHFTCDMLTQCANPLLIHVCVSIKLQQHRLFLQSREGVEAVLAYLLLFVNY